MQNNSITILSSRGRGISADLSLMRTHLNRENDSSHITFRSFSKNERSVSDVQSQGAAKLRRKFCEDAVNVICIDASLTGKITHPEGKRLLLAAPYDYQFKNFLMLEKKELHINTLKKFTHIIPGSPFTEKLLRSAYRLEGIEMIGNTALPLAWDLCQPGQQKKQTDKIAFYYPEIEKKKVLTFLVTGSETDNKSFFGKMDMKEFLKRLGEDWFVFTNSEVMMENAYMLSARYQDSFAYINRLLQPHELLYVTDVLVTNNGRMAASFAGHEKTLYCPLCGNTFFEKYMKQYFEDMCISDVSELLEQVSDVASGDCIQSGFARQFYYPEAENPYTKAAQIMELASGND